MAEIESFRKNKEEKDNTEPSLQEQTSQPDFSKFQTERLGMQPGNSNVSRTADALPSLNIDSAGLKSVGLKSTAEKWSFHNDNELLDRIMSGSSLFTQDRSKNTVADSNPTVPKAPIDGDNKIGKIILIGATVPDTNRTDSKTSDNKTGNDSKSNESTEKKDSEEKRDVAEKKGPVKLEQEKFDTDLIKKAFQLAKENNLPVIVYKGANFCGNCPPVSHAIDNLANDIKNKSTTDAVVVKLNWERAQELQKSDPELAKFINEIMPPSGSSFPDVKVYNPNDTSNPLKDGNGYGGDATYLKSLIKVGQDSFDGTKSESKPKDAVQPQPGVEKKVEPKPLNPTDSGTLPQTKIDGSVPAKKDVSRSSDNAHPPAKLPDLTLGTLDGKNVKLDDGSYKRDDQGRVTETVSADGKTKRSFKYEDDKNPNRITSETINDKTTYKYIGNCKVNNEPYKIDGKEVNSYSIYENDKLVGNWSGVREISPNGVYAFKDDNMQKIEYRDASDKKLSEEEQKTREKDGIWPSEFDVTTDDGTKIHAKLNGTRLDSLTETKSDNGKEKQIVWNRNGDNWTSNETPARERKNLSVDTKGNIRYESTDGSVKHELLKDGTRTETNKDGIKTSFNKDNQLTEIRQANGDTRALKYDGTSLSSITETTAGKEHQWKRTAGTDEWSDGQKKEVRKDLEVKADGSVKFKNSDGQSVKETSDLARITSDDQNRPLKVEYPSGSSRAFTYKDGKLDTVTDKVSIAGKEQSSTWTRTGTGDEFTSPGSNGKTRTRQDIRPSENGDYNYKTADGKDHKTRAYDIERQARGEIVVGSESIQEARDNFTELARERGLKSDRLDKYLNQLDATSKQFGTSPEQMAKALDNLSSILQAEKGKQHTREELNNLVETALHNIAIPSEIDQGYHPTCNVTTTEVYTAARFPEKYTDLLKQVALTGEYMTSYGKPVHPPAAAIKPGRDEKNYNLDDANCDKRNFASQIYQMTAINGVYELGLHSSEKDQKDNGTRYIMGEVRKKPIPNGYVDLGEDLLVDKDGKQKMGSNGEPVDGPEFIQDDNVTASELVTGKKMPYIGAPYKLSNEANWHYDLPTSERLLKAKTDGNFPMGVSTINGAHVQTIHDALVDSKGTTWVLLDNQHGKDKDGWVTLAELHKTQSSQIQLEPKRKPWERPN